jgi:4,5:9,10-diseco-3-hydroxy-5,9,17-trioxoandrosta-1(10),2-diene-4-oate hydrolase
MKTFRRIGIRVGVTIAALCLICLVLYLVGILQIARREPDQLDHVVKDIPGRVIDVNGRSVHVVEQGTGPVVLLVHGFAASTFDWEEAVLPRLATHYRTIALDLFGMGFSERDNCFRYGFDLWAKQIGDTLDALGIDRVVLVGHSLGGAAATLFAAGHPERVERLILISTLAPAGLRETPWWFFLGVLPGVGEFAVAQVEYLSPPGFSTAHYDRDRRIYRLTGTRHAIIRYIRGGVDFPRLMASYPKIKAPTLILHCTTDPVNPYSTITRVVPLLQNVRVVTTEDGGHWLYASKPDWLITQIDAFLQSDLSERRQSPSM